VFFVRLRSALSVLFDDEQSRRVYLSSVVVGVPETKDPGNTPTDTQTEAHSSIQSRHHVAVNSRLG
jgi:hypothetical protein